MLNFKTSLHNKSFKCGNAISSHISLSHSVLLQNVQIQRLCSHKIAEVDLLERMDTPTPIKNGIYLFIKHTRTLVIVLLNEAIGASVLFCPQQQRTLDALVEANTFSAPQDASGLIMQYCV